MLLGLFAGISAGIGVLVCALCGAFAGFGWLWIMPACFAGSFLLLAAMWFAMLLIMAKCVRMDQPQESDDRFYRGVLKRGIIDNESKSKSCGYVRRQEC